MRPSGLIGGTAIAALSMAIFSGCALSPSWRERQRLKEDAAAAQSAESMTLSQEAQDAIDRHDETRALGLLEQLVSRSPSSAEAHQRLGKVLQGQGRFAEAEASYRKALDFDSEYAAAQTGLGSIAASLGKPEEALKHFDEAIDLLPNQPEAHFLRGQSLEALGRREDALAAYFRALEFEPNSSRAQLRIATILLNRDEPDQALVRLDPIVEQNPDDAEARHQRGRAHLSLHHLKLAVEDLKFAAEKLPTRPEVHYHLALALEAQKDTQGAIAETDRALKLAPGYAEARSLRGKLVR